jgi:hypothetical protein
MNRPNFNFATTGVGSVPNLDVEGLCRTILERLPEIPFWPQFVKIDPREDMILQFCEGFSFLHSNSEKGLLVTKADNLEMELASFYECFLDEKIDSFPINQDRARGLYKLLDLVKDSPPSSIKFLKGQSVGPITFAGSVNAPDGRPLLHVPELLDAVVKGLGMKLLWQERLLRTTGLPAILFIDEPALSNIGSAFSGIGRAEVVTALNEMIEFVRERSDALIGIHCCANTDWPMIVESKPDIINFDAFGYLDQFLLYPDEIGGFINDGGTIAWGIVPTLDFMPGLEEGVLLEKLKSGLDRIRSWGFDSDVLRAQSVLTTACGMGSMEPESAREVIEILCSLGQRMRS